MAWNPLEGPGNDSLIFVRHCSITSLYVPHFINVFDCYTGIYHFVGCMAVLGGCSTKQEPGEIQEWSSSPQIVAPCMLSHC